MTRALALQVIYEIPALSGVPRLSDLNRYAW